MHAHFIRMKHRQDSHLQEDCSISLKTGDRKEVQGDPLSIEVVLVKGEERKKAILDPASVRTKMFCVVVIGTHCK